MFSYWALEETRDITTKRCVVRGFDKPRDGAWIDKNWHSATCNKRNSPLVLCQESVHALGQTLNYTPAKNTDLKIKGNMGQLVGDKTKEKEVFVSMSATVASPYLHRRWNDIKDLKMQGLITNSSLLLASRSDHSYVLKEFSPFFHQCSEYQLLLMVTNFGACLIRLSVMERKIVCWDPTRCMYCGYIGKHFCSQDMFRCTSGQCVPTETRCDLLFDYRDESDEADCECQLKECISGQCLSRSSFHDGLMDCREGDDEDGNPPCQ